MQRALLAFVAVLGLAFVPLGSANASYTDPIGDSRSAPDIRTVDVSNTETGVITFRVTAGLTPDTWIRATLAAAKSGVEVGEPYYVGVAMGPAGSLSTFTYRVQAGPVNLGIPVEASASADEVTFSFEASAFGIEEGFNFRMLSWHLVGALADIDNFPDGPGVFYYSMAKSAPPPSPTPISVKPVIGDAKTIPAQPRAGKPFTVVFPVTRSDTGTPLLTGTLTCTTKIAGKVIPHRHTLSAGKGRVTLTVPKTARGKRLAIAVKVQADKAAMKLFIYKIR